MLYHALKSSNRFINTSKPWWRCNVDCKSNFRAFCVLFWFSWICTIKIPTNLLSNDIFNAVSWCHGQLEYSILFQYIGKTISIKLSLNLKMLGTYCLITVYNYRHLLEKVFSRFVCICIYVCMCVYRNMNTKYSVHIYDVLLFCLSLCLPLSLLH